MPRTRRRLAAIAIVLGVLLVAPAPASVAHSGSDSLPVSLGSIEAETYDDFDEERDACEGRDGEHTRPVDDLSASGDQHLFLPHGGGCGVTFENVLFTQPARFDRVRVKPGNDEDFCREVRVLVDGNASASTQFCGDPARDWVQVSFEEPGLVERGSHDVRIEYHVLPGRAEWENLRIDKVSLSSGLTPLVTPGAE